MNNYWIFISLLFLTSSINAQLTVTEVGNLDEPVSNNAVCEGFIDDVPYLFSFGGIDTSKAYTGIHLRSYRMNLRTGTSIRIPDLPDTLGKIASAASRVGDVIYVSGGYHVFSNGSETTSGKMHRYDIMSNTYLTDAPDIPKATDDHVQVVWRDSLIYLITGWSNVRNIFNVQIYDPAINAWQTATPLPNNSSYKSFGASGAIIGDTIYYFGGATSDAGFGIQNQLRKGIIDPNDPTKIEWSFSVPDADIVGYRMACTTVGDELHWIGGSENTYNFDGIAYNGAGGVPPSNRDLYRGVIDADWSESVVDVLPMDLRGIARVNDTVQYVAGGMLSDQRVSDKVLKLAWHRGTTVTSQVVVDDGIEVFPNPFDDRLYIRSNVKNARLESLEMFRENGQLVRREKWVGSDMEIATDTLADGVYIIKIYAGDREIVRKVMKYRR